ncbi:MAG: hypothetical protein AAGB06_05245 [Verrucomicrobiota bacterium]
MKKSYLCGILSMLAIASLAQAQETIVVTTKDSPVSGAVSTAMYRSSAVVLGSFDFKPLKRTEPLGEKSLSPIKFEVERVFLANRQNCDGAAFSQIFVAPHYLEVENTGASLIQYRYKKMESERKRIADEFGSRLQKTTTDDGKVVYMPKPNEKRSAADTDTLRKLIQEQNAVGEELARAGNILINTPPEEQGRVVKSNVTSMVFLAETRRDQFELNGPYALIQNDFPDFESIHQAAKIFAPNLVACDVEPHLARGDQAQGDDHGTR